MTGHCEAEPKKVLFVCLSVLDHRVQHGRILAPRPRTESSTTPPTPHPPPTPPPGKCRVLTKG